MHNRLPARFNWQAIVIALLTTLALEVNMARAATSETDAYKTYSVSDIGKPGTPTLSDTQRKWLARIRCTSAYGVVWSRLRFAIVRETHFGPLAVYDPAKDNGFGAPLIGAPCGIFFDPFRHGIYAAPPDLACAPPTPVPIVKQPCRPS